MPALLLNNTPVVEARICLPRVGVWTADAVVDTDAKLSGSVTLKSEDGVSFVGVVDGSRAGVFVSGAHVRVTGGAGGMSTASAPQFYKNPTVRTVISALLQTAGEKLSSTSSDAILNLSLANWTVISGTVGNSIKGLLETVAPDSVWRVLPDGSVFIGTDAFTEAATDEIVVDSQPSEGTETIGAESPRLLPGSSFNGNRIGYVEHVVTSEKTRSVLFYEVE